VNAIDAIVEKNRPRLGRVAIESILSNLPGIGNSIGAFFGVRDVASAYKQKRDLGWLYLLRDIRQAASPKT
jgi:hypothetical protein